MSLGGRTYADQSYGAHNVIRLGGLSAATQTAAANIPFSVHQFMFPARAVGAKIRWMGNGITSGIEDLTQCTTITLQKSTDSGTGLSSLGTADCLGATGTWLMENADGDVDFTFTATDFNEGDMLILTVEGAWDDPIHPVVDVEIYEKFVESDS
jgi:hypothetical protein